MIELQKTASPNTIQRHLAQNRLVIALRDGRAFTTSELAKATNIPKEVVADHLKNLLSENIVTNLTQGPHQYYRLSQYQPLSQIDLKPGEHDATLVESIRTGPRDPALREARVCYDHLAGNLGVLMYDRMMEQRWLIETRDGLRISSAGWNALHELKIEPDMLTHTGREICKTCLDWSVRRHHLAGQLGALIFRQLVELGWATRRSESRIVSFDSPGKEALMHWLETGRAQRSR